jgi:site-specific DNA-methyltransferase (adenine-specific)
MIDAVRIEAGDCVAVMARLKEEGVRVDAVVTDPPYHLTSIVKRFGAPDAAAVKVPPASPGATQGLGGAYARTSKGFMGKVWDGGDVAFRVETWRAAFDVMKPGAHLVAFGGTRTYHRMACAIEDAGFEIRDSILELMAGDTAVRAFLDTLSAEQAAAFLRCIEDSQFGGLLEWVYGSGFPKSHDVSKGIDRAAGVERATVATERVRDIRNGHGRGQGDGINAASRDGPEYFDRAITAPSSEAAKQWAGWGTALKPAWEPIVLARKPLDGTVAETVLKHGTGALNIDGCRVGDEEISQHGRTKDDFGFTTAEAAGRAWTGRWPANVVRDGSPEVLAGFPETGPGQIGGVNDPNGSFGYHGGAGGKSIPGIADSGSAARFFYCAKADEGDRLGSKHPTVKPVDLMAWLVRLVTPPGGLVLDPFAGTGTTGMACLREGMRALLIEREAEYLADIRRRLDHVSGADTPLFGGSV